ncbi:NAD+ synthase [bacterium]|nr:MAG: NAD+ synthase [bacterium]
MKVGILQLNLTVGDLEGNFKKIVDSIKSTTYPGIDLFVTSELALLGYPPKDLLLNHSFIRKAWDKAGDLANAISGYPPLLLGLADINTSGRGKPLYNTAALLSNRRITGRYHKMLLPNYDVFDEYRYFEPATSSAILNLNGNRIGITICEDIWNDTDFSSRLYRNNPIEDLIKSGVDYLFNLSASPFFVGKQQLRETMLSEIAKKHKTPVLYTNQIGGNDDLVFDGRSCAFNAQGRLFSRAKGFQEDILLVDLSDTKTNVCDDDFAPESEAWRALVLGTKDYIIKTGFRKVILGLSGGIDSALTAVVAVDAIGKDNVLGVLMPSPFSSKGSVEDSLDLAKRLGIKTIKLPIKSIMGVFDETLKDVFKNYPSDVAEENIQSRIRGNLLMALSNKYNALLLTTGNKSELAVGYCTIYGDMSGGLAVIADVNKTMVYRIARWVNKTKGNPIPESSITKAPSAELKLNQTDQDTLPVYDTLDQILYRHIELHESAEEIIKEKFDKEIVDRVLSMVKKAEFKRKQAAPGIKITDRAFGTGWRMPIACNSKLY